MNPRGRRAKTAEPETPPRDRLVEATANLMVERGSVEVSLADIARRADLNSALISYYFGNKAGLLKALLDRDMEGIIHAVDALLAKDMAPEVRLRRHIGAVVDTYYKTPYLNRLLMRLVRESDPDEAHRIADSYLTPLSRAYDKLIEDGVREGVFRNVDPQLFYFTTTGACDRFSSSQLVLKHCYDTDALTEELRDRYRQHCIDTIMAGILAH